MIISLVAQGFCPFQVSSILRDFDPKNIRLFSISISMKFFFHVYILYIAGCDNKFNDQNFIVYLLITYALDLYSFYTDRNVIRVYLLMYMYTIRVEPFTLKV